MSLMVFSALANRMSAGPIDDDSVSICSSLAFRDKPKSRCNSSRRSARARFPLGSTPMLINSLIVRPRSDISKRSGAISRIETSIERPPVVSNGSDT